MTHSNHRPDSHGPNELQAVQMKANCLIDDSLESTRRMLALCEESKEAGIKTLVALDDQGEQLDHIEEGLDTINNEMKQAERALKRMGKCCGICILPWQRAAGQPVEEDGMWKLEDGTADSSKNHKNWNSGGPRSGRFITKLNQNDDRENELEDNLQAIDCMVSNLRNMAVDMSAEITDQNEQLERITLKAQCNENRVADANKKAVQLLKN